jgi:undecaprenyl diphosphate synthase
MSVVPEKLPTCLGFIMDGNRRWAEEQGKQKMEGHAAGFAVFQDVVRWVRDAGIPHAVFYAFSTENWQRTVPEVEYLMQLFEHTLTELLQKTEANVAGDGGGVRVRIIGRRSDFSPLLQRLMNELEEKSKQYTETTIWLALSYGGRAEIVEAVNAAVAAGTPVTEETFAELLWTAEMPDPDLIVRTSGEQRLSNFVTWRSVYSELLFLDKHWPALEKSDFDAILEEYATRERRRGR